MRLLSQKGSRLPFKIDILRRTLVTSLNGGYNIGIVKEATPFIRQFSGKIGDFGRNEYSPLQPLLSSVYLV